MAGITFTSGKADFLRVEGQGSLCYCEYNVDFSRGCINRVPAVLFEELLENNGTYTPERIRKYKEGIEPLPNTSCRYCYARRNNQGNVGPGEIGSATIACFEATKPKVLRLGKRSEVGHPYYRKTLIEFLGLCERYGTKVIFPTKNLGFDEEVARLLRDTGSVVHFSLGYDNLEPGACGWRCTNGWRIKQAEAYDCWGVNTTLTVVCDVTSSIEDNARVGSVIKDALNSDITTRIIPMRINSKALATELGLSWSRILKDSKKQKLMLKISKLESKPRSYTQKGSNELVPLFFHKDFEELVKGERRIGVCGRVGDMEYCDKCNLDGNTRVEVSISELVRVEYRREKRRSNKGEKAQMKLF